MDDKLLMSQGLAVSNFSADEEFEPKLPWVRLHLLLEENEEPRTFDALLCSLDAQSMTLSEFPLEAGVEILDMSKRKKITDYVLEADGFKFMFSQNSSVFLSVTGNYGMLTVTEQPRE